MHLVKAPRTGRNLVVAAFLAVCIGAFLLWSGLAGPSAQAQSSEPVYADVSEDAYYFDAVDALVAEGVFEGTDCDEGRFCPEEPLKRWQMAVWLIRALGETDPDPATQTRFGDVSDDDWWAPHVERMADLGITVGCSSWVPTKYCPDNNVNRGQMASFLTRALDLPPAEPAGFTDVNADSVHRGNINRLAAAGITLGCKSEPRQFCPHSSVTKAQMSAFIYRALEWLEENRLAETSTTAPTPVLISNDTDAFLTTENELSRHVKTNVIDVYGERQPWLRATWNHINRPDFYYLIKKDHPSTYMGGGLDDGGELPYNLVVAITFPPNRFSDGANTAKHIHELAHAYTLSNRIVVDPAPIAAGHLYFSELANTMGDADCQADEIYADAAKQLERRGAFSGYWQACDLPGLLHSDEAVEVTRDAFNGRMPQWFYDTFQDDADQINYEALWAAVGRIKDGWSRRAAVNQLRYSFGGYCSEAKIWENRKEFTGQPWRDGGC